MTKTKRRVAEAYEKGYRVLEDGSVKGPKGPLRVALYGKQRYPTFSTNWNGEVFGVPVHALAAYCFFGDVYIESHFVIRHLDGNVLNLRKDNIALGTHSENEADKPTDLRHSVAKLARQSQGFTPVNAKLTEEQVREIRQIYASYNGKKLPSGLATQLASRYGVSRTVLIKVKNKEYYPNVG